MIRRLENALIISGMVVAFLLVGVPTYIASRALRIFNPEDEDI